MAKVVFNTSRIWSPKSNHQILNLFLNKLFVWHLIWKLRRNCKQKYFSCYWTIRKFAGGLWPQRKLDISSGVRTVRASGACDLYYWQSSSIKQLFRNCDRIEAKQQSKTRSKGSTNLILRILIAKQRSNNPKQCRCSLPFACVSILLLLTSARKKKIFCVFLQYFLITFDHMKKQQSCIHPIAVSIEPS